MRGAWRRRMPAGLAVLLLAGAGAIAGSNAAGASTRARAAVPSGQVYLVHGILGTPLDVDVDGRRLAGDAPAQDRARPADPDRGTACRRPAASACGR